MVFFILDIRKTREICISNIAPRSLITVNVKRLYMYDIILKWVRTRNLILHFLSDCSIATECCPNVRQVFYTSVESMKLILKVPGNHWYHIILDFGRDNVKGRVAHVRPVRYLTYEFFQGSSCFGVSSHAWLMRCVRLIVQFTLWRGWFLDFLF